jgi:hypothetical protein
MTSIDQKEKTQAFLLATNSVYATRRSIPVLNATCWAKVDFIPSLGSAAEQELQDFMTALLKATRSEAIEALKVEEITAIEQTKAFQSTRTKLRNLQMVQRQFPAVVIQDQALQKSLSTLKDLSVRYDAINDLLEESRNLKAKDRPSLDQKIIQSWADTKTLQVRLGSF